MDHRHIYLQHECLLKLSAVLDHLNLWLPFIQYIIYEMIIFVHLFNIDILKLIIRTNNDLVVLVCHDMIVLNYQVGTEMLVELQSFC